MSPVLIVGATRGLGASLTKQYAAQSGTTVYGTTRSKAGPEKGFPESVKWLPEVDLMNSKVGDHLVSLLGGSKPLSAVVGRPFHTGEPLLDRTIDAGRLSRRATS